jgi:hypoxanthine phosphoribosyltransferase
MAKIKEVLIEKEEIAARIQELGREITAAYPPETQLLVVGILNGVVIFFADLVRCIDLPISFDFIKVSSYGGATESSGQISFELDLSESIKGRHVLLVEDIVDSGQTLQYLCRILQERQPASLRVCTLLDKVSRRKVDLHPDFCGFVVPDKFIIGFGMDFDQQFRQLPVVAVLDEDSI